MKPTALCLFAWVLVTIAPLAAEDLTTRDGQVYRNYQVIGHDAGFITILDSDGGGKIPLSQLPPDLQKKYGYNPGKSDAYVAQQVAADRQARAAVAQAEIVAAQQAQQDAVRRQTALKAAAAAAPVVQAPTLTNAAPSPDAQSGELSAFASRFAKSLVTLEHGSAHELDLHTLLGVKYWAFYYSASWCPPCRAFTPTLVDFYKQFKPAHPDFELVFVNHDQSEEDMLAYMTKDAMTWPAVRFSDLDDANLGVQKYCGSGIPCLVLVDNNGHVLSDTFRGGQYEGPEVVVDDIKSMVK